MCSTNYPFGHENRKACLVQSANLNYEPSGVCFWRNVFVVCPANWMDDIIRSHRIKKGRVVVQHRRFRGCECLLADDDCDEFRNIGIGFTSSKVMVLI